MSLHIARVRNGESGRQARRSSSWSGSSASISFSQRRSDLLQSEHLIQHRTCMHLGVDLARVGDLDLLLGLARLGAEALDGLDDVLALSDLAEDDVPCK